MTKRTDKTMKVKLEPASRYCDGDNVWHEEGEVFDVREEEGRALLAGRSATRVDDEKEG